MRLLDFLGNLIPSDYREQCLGDLYERYYLLREKQYSKLEHFNSSKRTNGSQKQIKTLEQVLINIRQSIAMTALIGWITLVRWMLITWHLVSLLAVALRMRLGDCCEIKQERSNVRETERELSSKSLNPGELLKRSNAVAVELNIYELSSKSLNPGELLKRSNAVAVELNTYRIFSSLLFSRGANTLPSTPAASLPLFSRQKATVVKAIVPFRTGQIRFQGSWWSARCQRDITLQPGELVSVVGRQNITLLVEPMFSANQSIVNTSAENPTLLEDPTLLPVRDC